MRYSNEQRIQKLHQRATQLHDYLTERDTKRDDVLTDVATQCVITTLLTYVGDHAYHLSAEYTKLHNEIPWQTITELRNLMRDFDEANWDNVATIVFDDLPVLIANLEKLM